MLPGTRPRAAHRAHHEHSAGWELPSSCPVQPCKRFLQQCMRFLQRLALCLLSLFPWCTHTQAQPLSLLSSASPSTCSFHSPAQLSLALTYADPILLFPFSPRLPTKFSCIDLPVTFCLSVIKVLFVCTPLSESESSSAFIGLTESGSLYFIKLFGMRVMAFRDRCISCLVDAAEADRYHQPPKSYPALGTGSRKMFPWQIPAPESRFDGSPARSRH